jgi:hypothetical protein
MYDHPIQAHIGPVLITSMGRVGGIIVKAPGAGRIMITAMVTPMDMTRSGRMATTVMATTTTINTITKSPDSVYAPNEDRRSKVEERCREIGVTKPTLYGRRGYACLAVHGRRRLAELCRPQLPQVG